MPDSFIIKEALWWPSVYIDPENQAILHQPGSNIPAQPLPAGWQFHWPLLSVIRVFHHQAVSYKIVPNQPLSQQQVGDEPIVAVSKDHQLFSVTGYLTLRLQAQAPTDYLAKLNRKHPGQIIRPLIRVAIRTVMKDITSQCLPSNITQSVIDVLQPMFDQYGIVLEEPNSLTVVPYQPRPAARSGQNLAADTRQ